MMKNTNCCCSYLTCILHRMSRSIRCRSLQHQPRVRSQRCTVSKSRLLRGTRRMMSTGIHHHRLLPLRMRHSWTCKCCWRSSRRSTLCRRSSSSRWSRSLRLGSGSMRTGSLSSRSSRSRSQWKPCTGTRWRACPSLTMCSSSSSGSADTALKRTHCHSYRNTHSGTVPLSMNNSTLNDRRWKRSYQSSTRSRTHRRNSHRRRDHCPGCRSMRNYTRCWSSNQTRTRCLTCRNIQ
mmetsp:Transcript_21745/g.16070  ORF Transcript_21745/g.16070 Transcript_21745/m.16070 type:complete len:235 (+) Transcript_21745:229-933(+)